MSENSFNFTDGIGKISRDLIESISLKLGLTELSVIQIRYLGAKGIMVLDETLPKNTVVLRPSMIKYRCNNPQAQKYLDILDYNKYKAGFLNRQVIILLKTLGIRETVF
jgi:RNA-dependent RNA polymerase